MDETCISCYETPERGTVFNPKQGTRNPCLLQRQAAKKRKVCMTLVAFVCNDVDVQAHLPQVLIANERTFFVRDIKKIVEASGGGMAIVRFIGATFRFCVLHGALRRQRSGWTNAKLSSFIIARLAAVLQVHASGCQCILFLDALRAHLAVPVMDVCARTNILPIIIPAGCTDILQPLDTHVFSAFKARLRELYAEARRESDDDVCMPGFVRCVAGAVRDILCGRDWSHAFAENGFDASQGGASERFARVFLDTDRNVDAKPISLTQLELCLPMRADAVAAMMWRRFFGGASCAVVPKRRIKALPSRVLPVLGKTRSQTRALFKEKD